MLGCTTPASIPATTHLSPVWPAAAIGSAPFDVTSTPAAADVTPCRNIRRFTTRSLFTIMTPSSLHNDPTFEASHCSRVSDFVPFLWSDRSSNKRNSPPARKAGALAVGAVFPECAHGARIDRQSHFARHEKMAG